MEPGSWIEAVKAVGDRMRYETLDGREVPAEDVVPQTDTGKLLAQDPESGRWVAVRELKPTTAETADKTAHIALPDEDDAHLVPAPTAPSKVARELVKNLYTHTDSRLILRNHKGDFYRWDGTCWPEAEARGIRGAAYDFLEDAVYFKVSKITGKETIESWNPSARKISDVLDALKAIARLDGNIEVPAWLEDDSWPASEIVPVKNGLLHVPTRQLLDHTPTFWSHHSLPFDYDPDAPEPKRWLEFLEELWGNDTEAISTLQEIFGYLIGGDTQQQKILLLVGPKRSGKGTIGRVLTGLLGKHNVAAPTLAGMATNFGISPLIDKPLALISDARLSSRADTHIVVERLLSVSGEDSITIDRKYKDPWTGRLPTRFLVLSNELPRLEDSSGALSSRFIMLVLTRSFYGKENPSLTAELLDEASGILNWGIEGLDRLTVRKHFQQPESGAAAIRQMEDLASPTAAFVRDTCVVDAGASVTVEDLWAAWKSWCDDENRGPGTKATFGRNLSAALPTVKKTRPGDADRRYVYSGIGIGNETNNREMPGLPGRARTVPSDRPSSPSNSLSGAKFRVDAPAPCDDVEEESFGARAGCIQCGADTYNYTGAAIPICAKCKKGETWDVQ